MMFKNVFKKIINKITDKSLIRGDCFSLQFFFYPSPIISKNLSLSQSPSYGRYFPLYSPLEPSPPTLVHHLSHHLSICPIKLLLQLFLSGDLSGNTVQRSTPHKCGHKSRYNAFNVVVGSFLQIFWSLPSSPCVREASLCGGNIVENHHNSPSKRLNHIQQIRGGISPRKAFRLYPTPKILVGKSQQSSISHSYLLGSSGSRIRIEIQYLSIWTLVSPRPSTYEFWTFAPTITPQNFGFSLLSNEKKQGFDFHDTRSHDSSIHTRGVDNSRASDLLLMF